MKTELVNIPAVNLSLAEISEGQRRHLIKDQYKSDQSTKFIGRGNGATGAYQALSKKAGVKVNCGEYNPGDVVFISANGKRSGRVSPDFTEIQKAVDAGATLLTDSMARRPEGGNPYNIGEQEVADFLRSRNYKEASIESSGQVARWCPQDMEPVFIKKDPGVQAIDLVKDWSEQIGLFSRHRFKDAEILTAICKGIVATMEAPFTSQEYYLKCKVALIDLHSPDEKPEGLSLFFKEKISTRDSAIDKISISSATMSWTLEGSVDIVLSSESFKRHQALEKEKSAAKHLPTLDETLKRYGVNASTSKESLPSDRTIRNVQVKSSF